MKLKLDELVDMFDEIQNYEYIVYDKKENNFIFIVTVWSQLERELVRLASFKKIVF